MDDELELRELIEIRKATAASPGDDDPAPARPCRTNTGSKDRPKARQATTRAKNKPKGRAVTPEVLPLHLLEAGPRAGQQQ